MASITVIRTIDAPVDVVFNAVADARRFAEAITGVTKLEFLSESTEGAGTKFRQSREMNGKETTMDFEVTEYVKDNRVRVLNETHGTIWDSLCTVVSQGPLTLLTMRMTTKSNRILMPLVCLFIQKAVEKDFDSVKSYCEKIKH